MGNCIFTSASVRRRYGQLGFTLSGGFVADVYTIDLKEIDTLQSRASGSGYAVVMNRDESIKHTQAVGRVEGERGSFITADPDIFQFMGDAIYTEKYDQGPLFKGFGAFKNTKSSRSKTVPMVGMVHSEDAREVIELFEELVAACKE